ncbi:MAG TPA: MFS transporter [Streptosporangiaceae bacterium]|nr:MFS transporter [Streptosporangiaceae bacterium]
MAATSDASAAVAAAPERRRDFRFLLGGFSASSLGSRISTIAYPLLVLALTGSAADAGWTGFAAMAPSILIYLPAGALVDRLVPRRVMLISEAGRGAVVVAVVVRLALGRPHIWELALAASAEQCLRVFAELAERRLTSSLLEPEREAAGLARSETVSHLVVLVGRPLGGLLFGIGRIVPFAADAVTFIVSGLALLLIKSGRDSADSAEGRPDRRERAEKSPVGRDIGDAIRWLRAHPFARVAMPITAGTTFIGQALIMIFLVAAQSQRLPPLEIGLVLGSSGAGGALGSASASWFFPRFEYALLHRQMWVWATALALLASSGGNSFAGMALAMAALGFTGALGNVAADTYLVRNVEGAMLARLMSFDRLTSMCALALGPLAGGIITQLYGTQQAVTLLFVMMIPLAAMAFFEPSMRSAGAQSPLLRGTLVVCKPPRIAQKRPAAGKRRADLGSRAVPYLAAEAGRARPAQAPGSGGTADQGDASVAWPGADPVPAA